MIKYLIFKRSLTKMHLGGLSLRSPTAKIPDGLGFYARIKNPG
ncbi:hypothetical protein CBUD_1939 [Coxiella burnetii Dugway 5J108-111]|uniref:Uncharacterized protein n=1 Tax=Coxiella burnetii (strain Dugway 5J108-111) TaxID=434922 RepID=A9KEN2_COXBN|nr:hypothetical protein CBUD_1939 [Coxiella burnetii Dugway 5J108-111]